jgi:hypothetical protein
MTVGIGHAWIIAVAVLALVIVALVASTDLLTDPWPFSLDPARDVPDCGCVPPPCGCAPSPDLGEALA